MNVRLLNENVWDHCFIMCYCLLVALFWSKIERKNKSFVSQPLSWSLLFSRSSSSRFLPVLKYGQSHSSNTVLWLHSCSLCAPWTCVIKVTPTLNSLLSNSQSFCLHTQKKATERVCVCVRASQHVLWQARSTVTSFVLDLIFNSSTIQLFGTTVSSRPLWRVCVCLCVLC